jgi:hypothetical protein
VWQTGDTWRTVKTTRAPCRRTNVSVVTRRRFLPVRPIQVRDEPRCETSRGPAGSLTTIVPRGLPDEVTTTPPVLEDPPALPAVPAAPADGPPEPAALPPDCVPLPTETDGPPEEPPAETPGVVALGVVALGVVTLGVVPTGVVTRGVVTDGVVTLGVVTGGVVMVGVGTGVVTGGVVTVVTGGTGTVTLGTVVGTVTEIVGTGGKGSAATACPARNPTPKSNKRNAAALMPLQRRPTQFGCGLRPSATFT